MAKFLFMPPIVFMIVLSVTWILNRLFSFLAIHVKKTKNGGGEAYACGEGDYNHLAQPDYSSFFPFAFFFTLAHVSTLVMLTVPAETFGTLVLSAIYIVGAGIGLYILFRK
ncbi:MAG: hypothetical protein HQL24_07805 [Candidatus Omnitrophica bacterium]|nr:hypothetical protein [Candidatus Omnitrophota bacterium]